MALLCAGIALLAVSGWAEPGFVGAEQCKLCHRDVYESWRRTPHAITETVDIDAEARCNACHATSTEPRLGGVQCEACHGPGGDYWPAEVMIDPEKASMAGLQRPTASCRRCHDNDEPGHRRDFAMPPRSEWAAYVHEVEP